MQFITVAEAARRLGIPTVQVYRLRERGELASRHGATVQIDAAGVEALRSRRHTEAARELPAGTEWAANLGASLREGTLRPESLHAAYRDYFGPHLLRLSASREESSGCPFCWADMAARVHQDAPRVFGTPAQVALMGGRQPCPRCRTRGEQVMEQARRTVEAVRADMAEQQRRERVRTAARAKARANTALSAAITAAAEADQAIGRIR